MVYPCISINDAYAKMLSDDHGYEFEQSGPGMKRAAELIWKGVFSFAIYDRADAIHFRPWASRILFTVHDGQENPMMPPPADAMGPMYDTAVNWISPRSGLMTWRSRRQATGVVQIESPRCWSSWIGVAYRFKGWHGVSWQRLKQGDETDAHWNIKPHSHALEIDGRYWIGTSETVNSRKKQFHWHPKEEDPIP